MNCCSRWWSVPSRAAIGCIDLRRPSVSSPRTYNSPAARWSLRASPPSIPAANSASRGRTSAICSGVIPAREYEEARNRGRVTFILNKVLLEAVVLAGRGDVQRRVAVEEPERLEPERDRITGHDGPVLRPRDVVDAEHVPQHDV